MACTTLITNRSLRGAIARIEGTTLSLVRYSILIFHTAHITNVTIV